MRSLTEETRKVQSSHQKAPLSSWTAMSSSPSDGGPNATPLDPPLSGASNKNQSDEGSFESARKSLQLINSKMLMPPEPRRVPRQSMVMARPMPVIKVIAKLYFPIAMDETHGETAESNVAGSSTNLGSTYEFFRLRLPAYSTIVLVKDAIIRLDPRYYSLEPRQLALSIESMFSPSSSSMESNLPPSFDKKLFIECHDRIRSNYEHDTPVFIVCWISNQPTPPIHSDSSALFYDRTPLHSARNSLLLPKETHQIDPLLKQQEELLQNDHPTADSIPTSASGISNINENISIEKDPNPLIEIDGVFIADSWNEEVDQEIEVIEESSIPEATKLEDLNAINSYEIINKKFNQENSSSVKPTGDANRQNQEFEKSQSGHDGANSQSQSSSSNQVSTIEWKSKNDSTMADNDVTASLSFNELNSDFHSIRKSILAATSSNASADKEFTISSMLVDQKLFLNPDVLKEGWLFKRDKSSQKKAPRWFQLKIDHHLYYFKDANDAVPLGRIPLALIDMEIPQPKPGTSVPDHFQISYTVKSKERKIIVSSEVESDISSWIEVIQINMADAKETFVSAVTHQGYLQKLSSTGLKIWRRRYCILKNGALIYYNDEETAVSSPSSYRGKILLDDCYVTHSILSEGLSSNPSNSNSISNLNSSSNSVGINSSSNSSVHPLHVGAPGSSQLTNLSLLNFKIHTPLETHFFNANSVTEMHQWFKAINDERDSLKESSHLKRESAASNSSSQKSSNTSSKTPTINEKIQREFASFDWNSLSKHSRRIRKVSFDLPQDEIISNLIDMPSLREHLDQSQLRLVRHCHSVLRTKILDIKQKLQIYDILLAPLTNIAPTVPLPETLNVRFHFGESSVSVKCIAESTLFDTVHIATTLLIRRKILPAHISPTDFVIKISGSRHYILDMATPFAEIVYVREQYSRRKSIIDLILITKAWLLTHITTPSLPSDPMFIAELSDWSNAVNNDDDRKEEDAESSGKPSRIESSTNIRNIVSGSAQSDKEDSGLDELDVLVGNIAAKVGQKSKAGEKEQQNEGSSCANIPNSSRNSNNSSIYSQGQSDDQSQQSKLEDKVINLNPYCLTPTLLDKLVQFENQACFKIDDIKAHPFAIKVCSLQNFSNSILDSVIPHEAVDNTKADSRISFFMQVSVFHGNKVIAEPLRTCKRLTPFFNQVLTFGIEYWQLAPEMRVGITVYVNHNNKDTPLAWINIPIIDYFGNLKRGPHDAGMWVQSKQAHPVGSCESDPSRNLVVCLEFEQTPLPVAFMDYISSVDESLIEFEQLRSVSNPLRSPYKSEVSSFVHTTIPSKTPHPLLGDSNIFGLETFNRINEETRGGLLAHGGIVLAAGRVSSTGSSSNEPTIVASNAGTSTPSNSTTSAPNDDHMLTSSSDSSLNSTPVNTLESSNSEIMSSNNLSGSNSNLAAMTGSHRTRKSFAASAAPPLPQGPLFTGSQQHMVTLSNSTSSLLSSIASRTPTPTSSLASPPPSDIDSSQNKSQKHNNNDALHGTIWSKTFATKNLTSIAGQISPHLTSARLIAHLQEIDRICKLDPLTSLSDTNKSLLWGYRKFLMTKPETFPKLFLAPDLTNPFQRSELHKITSTAPLMSPELALQLLDHKYPDSHVRHYAVRCLVQCGDEELASYLLQLVQVLQYEPFHLSPLAIFLLERALLNPLLIGHLLFWHLQAELYRPEVEYKFRLLTEALLLGLPPNLRTQLLAQVQFISKMVSINDQLITIPPANRTAFLRKQISLLFDAPSTITNVSNNLSSPNSNQEQQTTVQNDSILNVNSESTNTQTSSSSLKTLSSANISSNASNITSNIHSMNSFKLAFVPCSTIRWSTAAIPTFVSSSISEDTTNMTLPISSAMGVKGFIVEKCRVMDSAAFPLWLTFQNEDIHADPISILFKFGDDLRQDALTLQMFTIMDRLWKRDGLDMQMSLYKCLPTGYNMGIIEAVPHAETTAKIQKEAGGIIGAFKQTPLHNWLKSHCPDSDPRLWEETLENFTMSCAAYCVATYVIGVGDRHNDNIMVTRNGKLFHIDFAHFLGNIIKFGAYKRERAPFVLTPEFAYVMGGEKSQQFSHFKMLACHIYNTLRRSSSIFISLFELMIFAGLTQLTSHDDLSYFKKSLLTNLSAEQEASDHFSKLIDESLSTKTTQLNFAIHIFAHPD